jgi:dimethylargininase
LILSEFYCSLQAIPAKYSISMIAITRLPSPRMNDCELSFAERVSIDYERALAQHAAYRKMLADLGAEVVVLSPSEEFPDCVFVEDTAVVLEEVAIMASPGATSRRGEIEAVEEALRPYRPIEWIRLPATLDGGDVLTVGRTLFVGVSARTNGAGIAALKEIAEPRGYRVWPIEIRNCLHFKSACTALDDTTLLINPDWLHPDALESLAGRYRLVPIPAAEPFAADVLRIGQQICLPSAHTATADLIARLGYDVRSVDLSEFAKAEGGVTCLSVVF